MSAARRGRKKTGSRANDVFRELTPLQFQLLDKAADLYEKKAASIAVAFDELGIPGLFLATKRSLIAAGMLAIKNRDESEAMWMNLLTAHQRAALNWACIYYQGELRKLMKKEIGLLAETDDTEFKTAELGNIRELLSDQLELGEPVELMSAKLPEGVFIQVNGREKVNLMDIDAVSAEIRAALERDLKAGENDDDESE